MWSNIFLLIGAAPVLLMLGIAVTIGVLNMVCVGVLYFMPGLKAKIASAA